MNKTIVLNTQLNTTDYTDKRRKTALVLDVETALSKGNEQLIFDFGYTISEVSNERKVISRSYLVQEIFLDMSLMERAYYFNKYPEYLVALGNGLTQIKPYSEIIEIMNQDIKKYNVANMYAYNATFDSTAVNKTNKYINNADLKYEIKCLWNAATQTFMATQKYILTALENGWVTDKGNIKTSAEMAYRYLMQDYDFVEAHTATEDSTIETEILWAINRYGKRINHQDNYSPWRRVKDIKDKMGLES